MANSECAVMPIGSSAESISLCHVEYNAGYLGFDSDCGVKSPAMAEQTVGKEDVIDSSWDFALRVRR